MYDKIIRLMWYLNGSKYYTKSGYINTSKYFNSEDVQVNCSGKCYLITGANSGIGFSSANSIAGKGGTVYMVCRNPVSGEEAKNCIIQKTGNPNIKLHILDLSKGHDVVKFAKTFVKDNVKLNVLINNAGCMINTLEKTSEGLEKNFATNTLGTHLLTTLLMPLLQKTENSRVIIVTSGGMLNQKLNVDDPQLDKKNFRGVFSYAQNKRQQVVLTEEYAKMFNNVHFSCMHPGWADTPAVRSSMPEFYEKMKDKLRTSEQGADTIVWLAVAEAALSQPSGLFFQDRIPVSKHLPLACTKSSTSDVQNFMNYMQKLSQTYITN